MELQEADETEACSAECAADEELRAELRVDETVERTAEWAAEAVMRPLNSGSRRVAAQARVARRAEDETVGQALRDGSLLTEAPDPCLCSLPTFFLNFKMLSTEIDMLIFRVGAQALRTPASASHVLSSSGAPDARHRRHPGNRRPLYASVSVRCARFHFADRLPCRLRAGAGRRFGSGMRQGRVR